jgi:putative ABC transport system permease protein
MGQRPNLATVDDELPDVQQVAFAFRVTPTLLGMGLFYALLMGLIGGLLPAIRAARLPIASALREL